MKTTAVPSLSMHNACIVSDYISEFGAKLPAGESRSDSLDVWASENAESIKRDECGNIREIHGKKVVRAGLVTKFA